MRCLLAARCVQGKDRECVVVSMVRSNADGCAGGLWCDEARLNVALTRAKVRPRSLLGLSLAQVDPYPPLQSLLPRSPRGPSSCACGLVQRRGSLAPLPCGMLLVSCATLL